jgi:hypothetical protein
MSDFLGYLSWFRVVLLMVALMSGILSIIREWVLIYHPDKVDKRRIFWGCVKIAFVLSALMAWFIEHHAVVEANHRLAELTMPQLSAEIDSVATAPMGPQNSETLATLTASIRNQGAPTIIRNWSVDLELKSGRNVHGRLVPPPGPGGFVVLGFGDDPQHQEIIRLFEADHLLLQTKNRPIIQGSAADGWVQILFDVPKTEVVVGKMMMSFWDVTGKPYTLSYDFSKSYQGNPLGMNSPELQQKSVR